MSSRRAGGTVATDRATVPDAKTAPERSPLRFWWLLIIAVSIGAWVLAIKSFALIAELF
jgi:hypothetical protein